MTMASWCAISHHMVAIAAAYDLPAPLHDRTAMKSCRVRALRISRCFFQGLAARMFFANQTGSFWVLRIWLWLSFGRLCVGFLGMG